MAKANQAATHPASGFGSDERSVSAVIGTVLILAITVIGITAVLLLGGPLVQRLRDQSNLESVSGQMANVRQTALKLSGVGAQGSPQMNFGDGSLSAQQGTRMMITVDQDSGNPNCDFRITGWSTGTTTLSYAASTGCRAAAGSPPTCVVATSTCLLAYQISATTACGAGTLQTASVGGGVLGLTAPGLTASTDWCFRLTNAACPNSICAQAVLLHQDSLEWHQTSSQGDQRVLFEGGMLLVRSKYGDFLRNPPPISENAFDGTTYILRLPTLDAASTPTGYSDISTANGRATPTVLLSFASSSVRGDTVSTAGASVGAKLRLDFHGTFANLWANSLLNRNTALTASSPGTTLYLQDNGATCPDAAANPNRFTCMTYSPTAGAPKRFTILQEVIRASVRP